MANTKTTHTPEPTVIGDTMRNAGHKINDVSEHAGLKTDELIEQGQKLASQLQKEAAEYTDTVANYIKQNPVKSALIAGGIGLLLGHLLKK